MLAGSADDAQTLTVLDVVMDEGGTATVYLELSNPVDFAIQYYYSTRDSTARAIGDDYQRTSGTDYMDDGE